MERRLYRPNACSAGLVAGCAGGRTSFALAEDTADRLPAMVEASLAGVEGALQDVLVWLVGCPPKAQGMSS